MNKAPQRRVQDVISLMLMGPEWGFWGAVLAMTDIKLTEDRSICPSGSLGFHPGSSTPTITLNTDFIEKLTDKQLSFLLIHEVKHFIYMHPWQGRSLDREQFNIESDRYINTETLNDGLSNSKRLSRYIEPIPNLYYMEDLNSISQYSCLELYHKAMANITNEDGSLTKSALEERQRSKEALRQAADTGEVYGHIDSHDDWESITKNLSEDEAKETVKRISQEASKLVGTMPGDVQKLINSFHESKVPWRRHMRSWVGRVISSLRKVSWSRAHKVLPDDLPGMKRDYQSCVGFIIDVSGSISDADFVDFNSEAIHISKRLPAKVVQVDTEMKSPPVKYDGQRIKQSGITRHGYGGTDMNPGLKAMMSDPDVHFVILFTDGYIPQLDQSTICKPLLVVITRNGKMLDQSRLYRQLQIPNQ